MAKPSKTSRSHSQQLLANPKQLTRLHHSSWKPGPARVVGIVQLPYRALSLNYILLCTIVYVYVHGFASSLYLTLGLLDPKSVPFEVWDLITIPLEPFDLPNFQSFLVSFGKDGLREGVRLRLLDLWILLCSFCAWLHTKLRKSHRSPLCSGSSTYRCSLSWAWRWKGRLHRGCIDTVFNPGMRPLSYL